MSSDYAKHMAKTAVGKILLTLGWHSIQTTPLEVLTEIFTSYIEQMGQLSKEYANQFNCTEPNLDHLGLAYRDFHIDLHDLQDYVKFVNFCEPPDAIPKFPVPKEDHLNFLKPGSREVVTRPVHIHEHLPPMASSIEVLENGSDVAIKTEEPEECNVENTAVFKKPADVSPGEPFKRPRLLLEEEGRPTREISSVMMTTSGYLSPAREGKLPESRTPLATIDSTISVNTAPTVELIKKTIKVTKKFEKNREKGVGKELFKILPEQKAKKVNNIKEAAKMKQIKTASVPSQGNSIIPANADLKPSPTALNNNKINKTLAAARLKTEKLNTTITPIPIKPEFINQSLVHTEPDKLLTEPDKRKINIFKRISNVKNEKVESKHLKVKDELKQESRESSPDLIIDESVEVVNKVQNISNDVTIEIIPTNPPIKSPEKMEKSYFDDESPPGTPSTPKTPEMISQSPPLTKEKRKRKDKTKVKKVPKQVSPHRIDHENMEVDLERPKTPEAHLTQKCEIIPTSPPPLPFPFFPNFGGPGLIPPLFQHLPMANLNPTNFGHSSYMHSMYTNFIQPSSVPREMTPPKIALEKSMNLLKYNLFPNSENTSKIEKKIKEHKKEKRDKIKKKNKKDKNKEKSEKRKLKEEKKDKEKIKKEKKEKKKEKERENEIVVPKLTFKIGSASPHPEPERKLNIKPIVRKEEEKVPDLKREMSPELAKISALVTGQPKPKITAMKDDTVKDETTVPTAEPPARTPGPGRPRIHSIKQKPTANLNKQQTPVKDSEGNEVWICPACGRQDDGSPMIGCDDCDAWYHWVCVGIQVPPDDNEDWYCRLCIGKKQELLQTDKKKKRKKRERKEH